MDNRQGEQRAAWVHAYTGRSRRHIDTFPTKRKAVENSHKIGTAIKEGRHVAPSKSATLGEAATQWIAGRRAHGREAMTLREYQSHVDRHILPLLGRNRKLSSLTIASVRGFEDEMLATDRSLDMLRRVRVSLRSLLGDAMERGLVAQNVAAGLRAKHAPAGGASASSRQTSISRRWARSTPCWTPPRASGGRSCTSRYSAACALRS
jgi:hypothetical protein